VVLVSALLWGTAQGASASSLDFDLTLPNVVIRPAVSADIHLRVYVNGPQCTGQVLFAVHGFAHTAATWELFAEALFEGNSAGQKVCQIMAIDLPGHGESSLPTGTLLFGELTLDDYVTVLRGALAQLGALGVHPQTVLAHSQGDLLVQMTQQALKSLGTD